MNRHAIRAMVALAAVFAATPAAAADFTFDVPVRVENLPTMHTIWVSCTVFTAYPGGTIIGRRESGLLTMTGGNYEGTVTVEVNASGITPASAARAYSCSLRGEGRARTGAAYSSSPDNFDDVYQRATGHMLTTVNNTVRGTLP